MSAFNLQQAHEDEQVFLKDKNIRSLADINIRFCKKLASDFVYKNRLPKVGFFLGRLKALNEFQNFFDRNKPYFKVFFFTNQDILKLTLDCFKYGYDYKNLTEEAKTEIKNHFSNPKLSETFCEMMFDYKEHVEGVKPFDFSIRNIRNNNYSDSLISEIGNALLENDGTKFYNRAENKVVEILDFEDAITGVHFPIDFTGVTNKKLDSVVWLILTTIGLNEINFKKRLLSNVLEDNADVPDMFAFNSYYFDKIVNFISKQKALDKSELKKQLLPIITTDYLEFINSR